LILALAVCAFSNPAPGAETSFAVDPLGEGVHLFRPADDSPARVNSLVVERDDGLLVVAAQPSPTAARALLAAIDARISKPVRYLVLPHPHAEAAGGASAFPESVLVIGSRGCREALEDPQYDFGAEARARATDPGVWSEPPRRPPVLVLEARSTLADDRNPVELMPFGEGHSVGDLLVRLPAHDVFYLGALIFPDGRPYGGDARIGSWSSALNQFVREAPRVMVPLRGPTLGVTALRKQRDAFAWLRGQAEYGLIERRPHEEIREQILASPELGERFVADSPFLPELIDRTIGELHAMRLKHGGG
jgi:glyoxylase-like metal-dependent hydrolase (beta-lactamase superfamily II)